MTDCDGAAFERAFGGKCVLRQERVTGWAGIWLDTLGRFWLVEGAAGLRGTNSRHLLLSDLRRGDRRIL